MDCTTWVSRAVSVAVAEVSSRKAKVMEIKGLVKASVIDYPGKMAAVVFLPNCNFRCGYCQNPELIEEPQELESLSEDEVLGYLESRRKWIDGVCITGGEPTLHRELPAFIRKIKSLGIAVKLDTNGTNPGMLEELVKEGLLDYIAMDIKAPPERYGEVAGKDVDIEDIKRSVRIIMSGGADYEFRTTAPKGVIGKEDVRRIGEWLRGAKAYYLQKFRSGKTLDRMMGKEMEYSDREMEELAEEARPFFQKVAARL